jgi:hypothetical protein
MSPQEREPVLLYAFEKDHDLLAGRLVLLGVRPLRATSADEAAALISRQREGVRVALAPSTLTANRVGDLARMSQAAGPRGLRVVVVGERPSPADYARLRAGGAALCVWNPFTDAELRFVVNLALYDRTRGEVRQQVRVPTNLMARFRSGAGEKPALVYNLSTGGAYLETPRATMVGAAIQVTFPLPDGAVTVEARVVSTNVPGNLERQKLPRGMGVEFQNLAELPREAIAKYVAQRLRSYEL